MHARVNGYGCPPLFKPPMRRHIITNEQEEQFEAFMADKANVNISSYKIHNKTGLPLLYLNNHKEALWQKFHVQYPNGIGRTTFFNKLHNGPFVYREDLGGLCLTCNQYGFEMFHELSNHIIKEVENNEQKTYYIKKIEMVQRFLRREYCNHLKVSLTGHVEHDVCINHCLPYTFGQCNQKHTIECEKCSELFILFNQIKTELPHSFLTIDELQKQAEFYLSHQTRKIYLNHQFNANLLELDEYGAIIIVDYT